MFDSSSNECRSSSCQSSTNRTTSTCVTVRPFASTSSRPLNSSASCWCGSSNRSKWHRSLFHSWSDTGWCYSLQSELFRKMTEMGPLSFVCLSSLNFVHSFGSPYSFYVIGSADRSHPQQLWGWEFKPVSRFCKPTGQHIEYCGLKRGKLSVHNIQSVVQLVYKTD